MFETLKRRTQAIAATRAREERDRLAEQMREHLPPGIALSEDEQALVLSGRGLKRRWVIERELRWMRR